MVKSSINVDRELLNEIDELVEESSVYESRSHFYRVAIRELKAKEESQGETEFTAAR